MFTVGVTEYYPPYVMKSGNERVYGFDISLMNRICKLLQISCQYKQMPFNALLPSVMNGEIDAAISALIITNEREEQIRFSIPYMASYARFITRSDTPTPVVTKAILENNKIGVQTGTIYIDYIASLGLKNAQINYYGTENEQVEALNKKIIDFIITDNQTALWWSNNMHGVIALAGKPIPVGKGVGIAFAAKNAKYVKNFNDAILKLKETDIMKQLFNRYFSQSD